MWNKIKTFVKNALKSIEEAQMMKAQAYIRFHNKGLFKGYWD